MVANMLEYITTPYHTPPQFEGEQFVDGLLGIGAAGGKSSGAEGTQLASRLEAMRKERAKRTPVKSSSSSQQAPSVEAGNGNKDTGKGKFNHVSPQGAAPTRNGGNAAKRKKRRKKKQKGKR